MTYFSLLKWFLQFKRSLNESVFPHFRATEKNRCGFFFIVSFMDYLFKPNIFIFPRMKIKASCFSCAYTVDRALGLQIIL